MFKRAIFCSDFFALQTTKEKVKEPEQQKK